MRSQQAAKDSKDTGKLYIPPGPTNVVADHLSTWFKFPQHDTLGVEENINIASTDGTEYLLTTTESFQIPTEAYSFISSNHKSSVGHHGV